MSHSKNIGSIQPGIPSPGSFSVKLSSQSSSTRQLQEFFSQFKKGDALSVQIIKGLTEKTALINLKGREFIADTNQSVSKTETLKVIVLHNRPTLLLQTIADNKPSIPHPILATLRQNPPAKFDLSSTLETLLKIIDKDANFLTGKNSLLQNLLDEESLAIGGKKGSNAILNTVKHSGLFLENALKKNFAGLTSSGMMEKDLKATLLKLKELLQKNISALQLGGKEPLLKETVKNILQNIESNQALNVLAKEQGDHQLVQIPYLINGEIKNLKMYVQEKKGKGSHGNEEQSYIVLFLELPKAGKVRIDLKINKKALDLKLSVMNEDIQSLFLHDLSKLKKGLDKAGYKSHIDCSIACEEFIEKDLTNTTYFSDELSLLDCTA